MLGDINNFGAFSSEVWGTVSDWVMIIVTAFTGLYIVLTFREQVKTTKIQQRKFIYDIRPAFKLWIGSSTRLGERDNLGSIDYRIELFNNIAFSFQIVNETEDVSPIFFSRKIEIVSPTSRFEVLHGQLKNKYFDSEVSIRIFFCDEIGTEYLQYLHGKLADLRLDPPLITGDIIGLTIDSLS